MTITLPKPNLRVVEGVTVVEDSEIGSKFRIAVPMVEGSLCRNFFFATSARGASQLALTQACIQLDRRLTLYYTDMPETAFTPAMREAQELGARIVIVPSDDFSIVSAVAQKNAEEHSGKYISFDGEDAVQVIAQTAQSLEITPDYVWTASALGGITRGLQRAWDQARHYTVSVVAPPRADYGKATVIYEETPYVEPVKRQPPISCNPNFEGKAWWQMQAWLDAQKAAGQAPQPHQVIFWNPAAK